MQEIEIQPIGSYFEIDEDAMIVKPGSGGQIFNNSMIWERVVVSAFLTGQLDRMLDKTVLFTKKRKLNNKNLFEFQNIQHKIADIKTILNACKNLVYDAAYAIDTKPKNGGSWGIHFLNPQPLFILPEFFEYNGVY